MSVSTTPHLDAFCIELDPDNCADFDNAADVNLVDSVGADNYADIDSDVDIATKSLTMMSMSTMRHLDDFDSDAGFDYIVVVEDDIYFDNDVVDNDVDVDCGVDIDIDTMSLTIMSVPTTPLVSTV